MNVSSKTGANIEPDPQRAPLITHAFELVSAGLHKKSEVLRIVASEGLTTRTGKPIASQSFDHILTNPIYAGWVSLPSDPDTAPVRGLHTPIVTQELFDRVQAVLDGRKPPVVAIRKLNPDFPLRRLVRCEHCGTSLTGAFCKGRTERYPRYWCPKKGCYKVSLLKTKLESSFLEFLGRLQPDREAVADFPKIAARVWEAKQGGNEREAKKLASSLGEQKERKNKLLEMRMDGELSREEFEEAKAAVHEDLRDRGETPFSRFDPRHSGVLCSLRRTPDNRYGINLEDRQSRTTGAGSKSSLRRWFRLLARKGLFEPL